MNRKELISKSDFIISLGSMLADNREEVTNSIIESIAKTNAKFTYIHPIDNINMKLYYTQFIKYEVGSEEGICALLLDTFVKECDDKTRKFIDDLDTRDFTYTKDELNYFLHERYNHLKFYDIIPIIATKICDTYYNGKKTNHKKLISELYKRLNKKKSSWGECTFLVGKESEIEWLNYGELK